MKDEITDCAQKNIKKFKSLSAKALKQEYELPCGCQTAALEDLVDDYQCESCDTLYFYSFCLKEVVETDNIWHCKACGTCREISEWHCKKCNTCTYGLTLNCDGCGMKSPYMP